MFEERSRYHAIETATLTSPGGRVIRYVRRRFLPQMEALPLLGTVIVSQGDRLDLLTTQVIGDPEQFWRICDANNAMKPAELMDRTGAVLRVPQPTP